MLVQTRKTVKDALVCWRAAPAACLEACMDRVCAQEGFGFGEEGPLLWEP